MTYNSKSNNSSRVKRNSIIHKHVNNTIVKLTLEYEQQES